MPSAGTATKESCPWLLRIFQDLNGPSLVLARVFVQLLSRRSSSHPVIPPLTQRLALLVSLAYIRGLTPEQLGHFSVTKTELHSHSNMLQFSIYTPYSFK